jgi:hypothetical protein
MAIYRVDVVGESFHDRQAHISTIRTEMPAVLKREKDNPHGNSAVKILVADHPIGYIGKHNPWIAKLIDRGVPLSARVWKIKGRGSDRRGVVLEIKKGEDAEEGDFVRQGSYYDDQERFDDQERGPVHGFIYVILAVVIGALIGFFA